MQKQFRTRHNEEENQYIGQRTAVDFTADPGKTIQEPTEDADINILMKRMGVTDGSALPYFPDARAIYGDFSDIPTDPTDLANMMRAGELAFMKLPAQIRQQYATPEELFAFMNDDQNYEEAVRLGLLQKKKEPVLTALDKLVNKMDTLVSSSTSRDKEPLVPPSNSKEK